MQSEMVETSLPPPIARSKGKTINRPGTWFKTASSSSASSSSSGNTITLDNISQPSPPTFGPGAFRSPFPSSKGKHKLSPSPSPRNGDDFVMISPVRPPVFTTAPIPRLSPLRSGMESSSASGRSSSPIADSPTPACGMASATARLKLADDDSPIRRVPGNSRSLRGAIEDGGKSIFINSDVKTLFPPSPLKRGDLSGTEDETEEEGDGSPRLLTATLSPGPPPQPLFPVLRTSRSQDCDVGMPKSLFGRKGDESRLPRLSTSHPLRARASLDAERPTLGSKKAISLDAITTKAREEEEPFGHPISTLGKKSRPMSSTSHALEADTLRRAHKRINSGEYLSLSGNSSISRSAGHKSGLTLSLNLAPSPGTLPDLSSNSSLSTYSTSGLTPPASAFSSAERPTFDDVKPLAEAFEQPSTTVSRKFKPRDSGVSMGDDEKPTRILIPPPSVMKPAYARPRRPAMLKRTSSMGAERSDLETPSINPSMQSGWPGAMGSNSSQTFNFLGDAAANMTFTSSSDKKAMPNTPVKKHAYGRSHGGGPFGHRVGHSMSHPSLASEAVDILPPLQETTKANISSSSMFPPPSAEKPPPSAFKVPHLILSSTLPDSPSGMHTDQPSPTVMIGAGSSTKALVAPSSRVGMLRRTCSGAGSSESEEDTPTKYHGDRVALAAHVDHKTPTPSPSKTKTGTASSGICPRLSLPAFAAPKQHRTLHHRQSHPAPNLPEEEDVFEKRFITLETLGKGAFSTVLKVQDRYGDGLYAVKKARGVFDGVKDRLRHLEEVDILRHLSKNVCPHVIKFEGAWEQNRQLYIQTELCLGSLAFFLEEYGRVVERLDESRVWKIVRELSDGINHIHSNGVIHFDIKPANVLISSTGSLKIGDFGLATRWPRVSPAEIIHGSGLGGIVPQTARHEKLEREGDRVYMPPEMLRGVFVMAADVFSFGLVILEVSTNICVPDGGAPWQALRSNDFSVVDLSPLSPALSDLIIQCMSADPASRPTIQHIVGHPIVQRARKGKDALAPEDPRWLVEVLTGTGGGFARTGDGDVEME